VLSLVAFHVIGEAELRSKKIFIALTELFPLPPTRQTQGPRLNPFQASQLFIQSFPVYWSKVMLICCQQHFYFQDNTVLEQAIEQVTRLGMIQPGIMYIGSKIFMKLETDAVEINVGCVSEAVAYLIAAYFVFNCKYPEPLTYVYGFLENVMCLPKAQQVLPTSVQINDAIAAVLRN
jgi:hypothetical protein